MPGPTMTTWIRTKDRAPVDLPRRHWLHLVSRDMVLVAGDVGATERR